MSEKNPIKVACETFDNCPNRTIEQEGNFVISVTCPRYPDGTTFMNTERLSRYAEHNFDQDPERGKSARRIGCLGCKYSEMTPDELDSQKQMEEFHPLIAENCGGLYVAEHFTEAAMKGFMLVRDRLRELTGHERATEAFGKGGLRINSSVAEHVDDDFQKAVMFLAMSGDMFRNVGSHTADNTTITGSQQARSFLTMSSMVMHYLDNAEVNKTEQ